MKLKLLVASMLAATTVMAEDYQLFTDVSYQNTNFEFGPVETDMNAVALSGQYFFSDKTSLGPLNEFEYINSTSNVFGNYFNVENGDFYSGTVGGELFVNSFLVGASYSDDEDGDDVSAVKLGYLISDDLLVDVEVIDNGFDTVSYFSAAYNYQLNKSDYIGFSMTVDDEGEQTMLSSKYFTALSNGGYLTASLAYMDNEFDDAWALESSYYFNEMTSVSAGVTTEDEYSVGVRHFFNKNVSANIGYQSGTADIFGIEFDQEVLTLGVSAQF
ncbi:putative porin [Pleionea sediminis]|uniref:putative porin n=1 Tax=Pleionea sediminis TaxID=2569479 RepID=UPI001185ACE3|nr:putative porin [Pleionea sediminis]